MVSTARPTPSAKDPASEKAIPNDKCLAMATTQAYALLPALKTAMMEPKWRCHVPNVSLFLRRIDRIRVVRVPTPDDASPVPIYAIQSYYEVPTSRIPTINNRTAKSTDRNVATASDRSIKPSLRTERTAKQFSAFRDTVQSCAHGGRQGCTCAFCEQLNVFLTFGGGRSLAFASLAFDATSDASEVFELLLRHLLDRCQWLVESGRPGVCRGKRHIPYLLYAFLRPSQE